MLTIPGESTEENDENPLSDRLETLVDVLKVIAAGVTAHIEKPLTPQTINVAAPNVTVKAPESPAPTVQVTGPKEWTTLEVEVTRDNANWIRSMKITRKS